MSDLFNGNRGAEESRPRSRSSGESRAKPKDFLTVGQAARLIGVSTSTIRLWENMGLVSPERSKGGFRLYSPGMIATLKRIKRLKAVEHLNVHGIKRELRQQPGTKEKPAKKIGATLRIIRQRGGISLTEAAKQAGITVGYLSAIERSQVNAPYRAIKKLASVYGTSVLGLYHPPDRTKHILRSDDRSYISAFPGYDLEMLSIGARSLECMIFRVNPGAGASEAYAHEGEEFVYILSGRFEIWLGETEKYVLRKGDSLWYDSDQRHRWQNPSKREKAVVLWVVASSG